VARFRSFPWWLDYSVQPPAVTILPSVFMFIEQGLERHNPSMNMYGAEDVPLSVGLAEQSAMLMAESGGGGLILFLEPLKYGRSFPDSSNRLMYRMANAGALGWEGLSGTGPVKSSSKTTNRK